MAQTGIPRNVTPIEPPGNPHGRTAPAAPGHHDHWDPSWECEQGHDSPGSRFRRRLVPTAVHPGDNYMGAWPLGQVSDARQRWIERISCRTPVSTKAPSEEPLTASWVEGLSHLVSGDDNMGHADPPLGVTHSLWDPEARTDSIEPAGLKVDLQGAAACAVSLAIWDPGRPSLSW